MLPSAQTIAEPMPFTVQPHLTEASPIVCQHNNPIAFICRSQKCLKCDSYLVCSQDCIVSHFKHPEDLIPYQTFTLSLPSLRKQQINMQLSLSSILRETINKLLHLRITVSQQIDKELEKVKSMMVLYQREDELAIEGGSEKRIQKIKEYIYKIQDYNKNEDTIVYNVEREQEEEEKQVEEDVKRMWRRLGRNIKELLGTDIGIFEGEEVSEKQKKKCYEYKVEGNITKVVKLIKSTPKHVDRLKIYLNEDTQPQWYADMASKFLVYGSLRNYKQTYETLLKSVGELDWVKKISLAVWDNHLQKENKLELITFYRREMKNVDSFIVDDKLKGTIHQI